MADKMTKLRTALVGLPDEVVKLALEFAEGLPDEALKQIAEFAEGLPDEAVKLILEFAEYWEKRQAEKKTGKG
jgi:hypothetical protein